MKEQKRKQLQILKEVGFVVLGGKCKHGRPQCDSEAKQTIKWYVFQFIISDCMERFATFLQCPWVPWDSHSLLAITAAMLIVVFYLKICTRIAGKVHHSKKIR